MAKKTTTQGGDSFHSNGYPILFGASEHDGGNGGGGNGGGGGGGDNHGDGGDDNHGGGNDGGGGGGNTGGGDNGGDGDLAISLPIIDIIEDVGDVSLPILDEISLPVLDEISLPIINGNSELSVDLGGDNGSLFGVRADGLELANANINLGGSGLGSDVQLGDITDLSIDANGSGASDIGSLINMALLDGVPANVLFGGAADTPIASVPNLGVDFGGDGVEAGYDGHVPLVGDISNALGSTLDLLTTTTSIADVPALDFLNTDLLDL